MTHSGFSVRLNKKRELLLVWENSAVWDSYRNPSETYQALEVQALSSQPPRQEREAAQPY